MTWRDMIRTFSKRQRAVSLFSFWALVTGLNVIILPHKLAPVVQAEVVRAASMPLIVRAAGVLQPKESRTLKAEFDGPILFKGYRDGDKVRVGQRLLEIGRNKIKPDYDSKLTALKNAKADLDKARKDWKLQKALYQKEAVSLSSVEDAQRAVVKAVQAVESARSAFHLEEERWNKNKFIAPFSGTVIKDFVEDERNVSSGKEVVTVADISEYSVRALVDELEIGLVKMGQTAQIRVQAYDQSALTAVVVSMGAQAEGNAVPEIPVILRLDKTEGLPLLPKLTAETRILVGEVSHVLSIPLTAVDNADGKPKVWALGPSDRLQQHLVGLGRSNPERVEITQGLAEGERICLKTDPHFANGIKVKVAP